MLNAELWFVVESVSPEVVQSRFLVLPKQRHHEVDGSSAHDERSQSNNLGGMV